MTEKLFGYVFDCECPNITQMWQSLIDYVYPIINNIPLCFSVLFQSPMYGIDIHYVQHFQAKLELGVCELAHFFIPSLYFTLVYISVKHECSPLKNNMLANVLKSPNIQFYKHTFLIQEHFIKYQSPSDKRLIIKNPCG